MTNYENYRSWIEQYVTPSIVHLTCATKEEPLWRQIHYQILLKTRSDSSKVILIFAIDNQFVYTSYNFKNRFDWQHFMFFKNFPES